MSEMAKLSKIMKYQYHPKYQLGILKDAATGLYADQFKLPKLKKLPRTKQEKWKEVEELSAAKKTFTALKEPSRRKYKLK